MLATPWKLFQRDFFISYYLPVKVSFSVSGFSARGRVVVGSKGISGADVIVQGKKVAETDSNGYYTLQALTVSV